MKNNRQKFFWVIDAILLLGFLFSFFLDVTGLDLHQWLGLGVGLLAGYHLLAHGSWVKAVTVRFLNGTSWRARAYWGLDAALMMGMGLIGGTGLLISTWFNLPLEYYVVWKTLHVAFSVLTLAVLWVKIALHWRWIVKVAGQFASPPAPRLQPAPVAVQAPATPGRRQFLALMGTLSAASLLAASRAFDIQETAPVAASGSSQPAEALTASNPTFSALANQAGQSTPTQAPTATPLPVTATPKAAQASATAPATAAPKAPTATQKAPTSLPTQKATTSLPTQKAPSSSSSSGSGSSSTCRVACNRRCSFPGKCRRYVDTNGNQRCDLGECA